MAAPGGHAFQLVRNILFTSRSFSISNRFIRCHDRCLSYSANRKQNYENRDRKETHFGFEYIPEEEKQERVHEVFENVADKYDLMNDAMSVGVHRLWKDCFVRRLGPVPGTRLIDVAGGTGDIAFRCLDYSNSEEDISTDHEHMHNAQGNQENNGDVNGSDSSNQNTDSENSKTFNQSMARKHTHVTICDINQAMLDVGKKKALDRGFLEGRDVSWLCGNAECLPLTDNTFDGYTIAFGIRNVTHIDKVLEEAYRILKPGGRFMCLEFSRVENPILRSLYDSYSFQVIPVMGQVIARDWNSYQYLVESIRQFPDQRAFAEMIRNAGFKMVTYENLTFGVAAIHSGFKI